MRRGATAVLLLTEPETHHASWKSAGDVENYCGRSFVGFRAVCWCWVTGENPRETIWLGWAGRSDERLQLRFPTMRGQRRGSRLHTSLLSAANLQAEIVACSSAGPKLETSHLSKPSLLILLI
jgi:hypothetical protein